MPTPYTLQTGAGTSNVKSGPQTSSATGPQAREAAMSVLGDLGKSSSARQKEIDAAADAPSQRGGEANAVADHQVKPGTAANADYASRVRRGKRL